MNSTRKTWKQWTMWVVLVVLLGGIVGVIWSKVRQGRLNDALLQAVEHSDLSSVTDLLKQGADANAQQSWPVTWDTLRRRVRRVKEHHPSALHLALANVYSDGYPHYRLGVKGPIDPCPPVTDEKIVTSLLDYHASPYDDDPSFTLLGTAIGARSTPCIQTLIAHGAKLPPVFSTVPLLAAAIRAGNSPEAIDALIRADADTKGEAGRKALSQAYQDYSSPSPGYRSKAGDLAILQRLLEAGADPNSRSDFGWLLLRDAVQSRRPEVVRLLLKAHADPNSPAESYETPLLYLALDCPPETLQALLEAGGNANTHDRSGEPLRSYDGSSEPLLYYAAVHKRGEPLHDKIRKVQLLLEHGANPNEKFDGSYGHVSIREAARKSGVEQPILKLLEHGKGL